MVLANARLVLVVIDIPILMETSVPVLTVKLVRLSIIISTILTPVIASVIWWLKSTWV